ncbi:MAG: GntR family transcriptional regulator [Sphingobium sp.]
MTIARSTLPAALRGPARSAGAGQPVASQRVADILADRILSGRIPPGARIKQDELAEELNTSRIPVRDALRILEARGLVTLRANAGARVASMTLRDLEISYEIRERIEPLLLADSVPNLTDRDISEMHLVREQLETTRDVEIFLALDRQFHWTAYRRHRAPQLHQIIERLWDTTQSYRRAFAALALPGGARIMLAEHSLLLHAVERRDADTASAVLVTEIRRTRVNLGKYGELGSDETVEQP